jgi:hypothetical protein
MTTTTAPPKSQTGPRVRVRGGSQSDADGPVVRSAIRSSVEKDWAESNGSDPDAVRDLMGALGWG